MATKTELQFVIIVSTFWIVAAIVMLYGCAKRCCRKNVATETNVRLNQTNRTDNINDNTEGTTVIEMNTFCCEEISITVS